MPIKLPTPIAKRDILYSPETPKEQLSDYGRQYLEANLLPDALEFFAMAKDEAGMTKVKEKGIDLGDSYLLRRLERVQAEMVKPADWLRLGETAWSVGKFRDALEAFTRAGNDSKRKMAMEELGLKDEEEENPEEDEEDEKKPGDPKKN